jgi:hypothetical protein
MTNNEHYRPATTTDYEAAGVLPLDYPSMTVRDETDEDMERDYQKQLRDYQKQYTERHKARNTNPTSMALAKITNGARSLYLSDKAPTQSTSSSELYQSILEAVSYLARRNGNDLSGILTLANELTETDKD